MYRLIWLILRKFRKLKEFGISTNMSNADKELVENLFSIINDTTLETISSTSTTRIEDRLNGVDFLPHDDSDENNSLFPNLDDLEWPLSGQYDFPDVLNNAPTTSNSFNCVMGSSNNNNKYVNSTTATSITCTNTQFDNNYISNNAPNIDRFGFSENNDDNNQKENMITTALNEKDKDEDTDDVVKQKLLLRNKKNAEMAKASRQKKKNYLQNLENKVHGLIEDNNKLKQEKEEIVSLMKKKDEEINYLKNILANHTAISQMLGTISQVPVVKKIRLSAECSPQDDHLSESSSIPNFDHCPHSTTTAGICLHFKPSNHISLEYCTTCSQSSQMAILQQKEQEQFYAPDEVVKS